METSTYDRISLGTDLFFFSQNLLHFNGIHTMDTDGNSQRQMTFFTQFLFIETLEKSSDNVYMQNFATCRKPLH